MFACGRAIIGPAAGLSVVQPTKAGKLVKDGLPGQVNCLLLPYDRMPKAYILDALAELLSSKVKEEGFRLLFGVRDERLHLRELARQSGFY